MPIRFKCDQCGQRLSVATRKAGSEVTCPRCEYALVVPTSDDVKRSDSATHGSDDEEEIYSEFAVFDRDEIELVYDEQFTPPTGGVIEHRVAIPRLILYLQGVLIGVVAIISFFFGYALGRNNAPATAQNELGMARPCQLSGVVQFSSGDREVSEVGAVVIILPQNSRPGMNEKIPVADLRPDENTPHRNHPALQSIRELGGDYTRTDANGSFQLMVPKTGRYYVLILSARSRQQELSRDDIAQIGRYFIPATDLLGSNRYRWKAELVTTDKQVNFVLQ